MSASRIGLFLIALVALVGLAIQNNTPSITLMFLGMRSQPLPLGVLVLAAFGCGVATGLVILMLLRINGYLAKRQGKAAKSKKEYLDEPPNEVPEPFQQPTAARGWGQFRPKPEPEPEPEAAPWDDWVEAEEPKTVYDADFRVIRPPQPSDSPPEDDFDDQQPRRGRRR